MKCIFEEAFLSWKSGQACDEETCLLRSKGELPGSFRCAVRSPFTS